VPQAGKMLDQALERQRVTTSFRGRVTPELERYFS
jgi:hypothetical protein